jgi:hypothetical protein
MVETKEKAAVITVDVETGRILGVEGINGAQVVDIPPGELLETYGQTGAGYNCVGWIVHSHSSPGCLRLIGGSLVKVC